MSKLNNEEQEILEAFEHGKLKRSKNVTEQLESHQVISETSFKKDARINIRLSSKDLRAIQSKALKEGMPYQTLVSSVIHKYVDGQLIEKAM